MASSTTRRASSSTTTRLRFEGVALDDSGFEFVDRFAFGHQSVPSVAGAMSTRVSWKAADPMSSEGVAGLVSAFDGPPLRAVAMQPSERDCDHAGQDVVGGRTGEGETTAVIEHRDPLTVFDATTGRIVGVFRRRVRE